MPGDMGIVTYRQMRARITWIGKDDDQIAMIVETGRYTTVVRFSDDLVSEWLHKLGVLLETHYNPVEKVISL